MTDWTNGVENSLSMMGKMTFGAEGFEIREVVIPDAFGFVNVFAMVDLEPLSCTTSLTLEGVSFEGS